MFRVFENPSRICCGWQEKYSQPLRLKSSNRNCFPALFTRYIGHSRYYLVCEPRIRHARNSPKHVRSRVPIKSMILLNKALFFFYLSHSGSYSTLVRDLIDINFVRDLRIYAVLHLNPHIESHQKHHMIFIGFDLPQQKLLTFRLYSIEWFAISVFPVWSR